MCFFLGFPSAKRYTIENSTNTKFAWVRLNHHHINHHDDDKIYTEQAVSIASRSWCRTYKQDHNSAGEGSRCQTNFWMMMMMMMMMTLAAMLKVWPNQAAPLSTLKQTWLKQPTEFKDIESLKSEVLWKKNAIRQDNGRTPITFLRRLIREQSLSGNHVTIVMSHHAHAKQLITNKVNWAPSSNHHHLFPCLF